MRGRIPENIYCLEITTNIGCSVNCKYCPQGLLIKSYTDNGRNKNNLMMSFELFKKCIGKVVKKGTVSFCGMSEPFLNPECAKMIKYAYAQGYSVNLFTTLVGMKKEDLELIKDVKFNNVVLHIPDEEGNARFNVNEEYLSILKMFSQNIRIDSYSCHGTVHKSIRDYISEEVYMRNKLHGRAGNVEEHDVEAYSHTGSIVCTCGIGRTGATPILLPDGRLLLCGNDYGMRHVLGNLYLQEWNEIASGEEMKKILYGFQDDTYDTLCRHCHNAIPATSKDRGEFLVGPMNALVVSNLLQDIKDKKYEPNEKQKQIANQLTNSKNICIFGCGKLFRDNYFLSTWNDVIGANILTDNNAENLWSIDSGEMQKILPEELQSLDDLLVVTYVKESQAIEKQLQEMNISNIVNIYDIYNFSVY